MCTETVRMLLAVRKRKFAFWNGEILKYGKGLKRVKLMQKKRKKRNVGSYKWFRRICEIIKNKRIFIRHKHVLSQEVIYASTKFVVNVEV